MEIPREWECFSQTRALIFESRASSDTVSFTLTYHTWQFIIIFFTIFTITTCIFFCSFSLLNLRLFVCWNLVLCRCTIGARRLRLGLSNGNLIRNSIGIGTKMSVALGTEMGTRIAAREIIFRLSSLSETVRSTLFYAGRDLSVITSHCRDDVGERRCAIRYGQLRYDVQRRGDNWRHRSWPTDGHAADPINIHSPLTDNVTWLALQASIYCFRRDTGISPPPPERLPLYPHDDHYFNVE